MTARTMAAALALALVAPGLFTACEKASPEELARSRFRALRLDAFNGDVTSQLLVAEKYHKGKGVPQSTRAALHWYNKAAYWLRQAARQQHTNPKFLRMPGSIRYKTRRIIERMQAAEAAMPLEEVMERYSLEDRA